MSKDYKNVIGLKQVDRCVLDKNYELHGKDIAKYYFIEESAELIKELTKSMRGLENRGELIKEMGDVYYTLSMLMQEYNVSPEEINDCIDFKEKRAKNTMNMDLEEKV